MNPKNLVVGSVLLAGLAVAPNQAASAATAQGPVKAVAGTSQSAGILLRPKKKKREYNRGFRDGYRQGVKDGHKSCSNKSHSRSFSGSDSYTRGWVDGYNRGFWWGCHHRKH